MTCKDCIHREICYKENEYNNFPNRCGEFISIKVFEKETQKGKWQITKLGYAKCPYCRCEREVPENFCGYCGADMREAENESD